MSIKAPPQGTDGSDALVGVNLGGAGWGGGGKTCGRNLRAVLVVACPVLGQTSCKDRRKKDVKIAVFLFILECCWTKLRFPGLLHRGVHTRIWSFQQSSLQFGLPLTPVRFEISEG